MAASVLNAGNAGKVGQADSEQHSGQISEMAVEIAVGLARGCDQRRTQQEAGRAGDDRHQTADRDYSLQRTASATASQTVEQTSPRTKFDLAGHFPQAADGDTLRA